MALTLELYAHGVSKGHKTWGSKSIPSADVQYFGTFYDRFADPELMIVEQRSVGGETHCYYTFVKNGLVGADGRGGSYFALTLRFNAYYADLQNLYGILRAAYEKMCVGTCVKVNGAVSQICITDFAAIDSQLRNVEKNVIEYISTFSVSTDICQLSPRSGNTTPSRINLAECTSQKAKAEVQAKGCVMVSPLFPADETARILAQKDQQMSDFKSRAAVELQGLRKEHDEALTALRTQHEQALNDVRAQQQSTIEELRKKVESADARVKNLVGEEKARSRQQVEQKQKLVDELNRKIESLNNAKENLEKAKKELEKQLEKQQKELQQQLKTVKEKGIGTSVVSAPPPKGINELAPWLTGVNTVFLFLVLLIVSATLIFSCPSKKKDHDIQEMVKKEVVQQQSQNTEDASSKKEDNAESPTETGEEGSNNGSDDE